MDHWIGSGYMPTKNLQIIPEPKSMKFSGSWARFDGFRRFPLGIAKDFGIQSRNWRIVEA
jgi:hypothetical protein